MKTYVGRGAGAFLESQISNAEQYLLISSPWINPKYAEKLVRLARNGVIVKVITSNEKGENQAAIRVFEKALKPERDWLGRVKKDWAPPPMDVKVVGERLVHAKIYCVDGRYAVVGSVNFTEKGLWSNAEHIIIFEKPEEVEIIEEDFAKLWKLYETKEIVTEITSKSEKKSLVKRILGLGLS